MPRISERFSPISLLCAAVLASLAGCGGDDPPATQTSPTAMATAAAVDDVVTVDWNQATAVDVMANDTTANGAAVVSVASAPSHGTATVQGTAVSYLPAAGYVGTDAFTYLLSVGSAASSATAHLSVAASVSISGRVVDAPLSGASVVATVGGVESAPVTADADGNYTVTVKSSDPKAFVSLKATGTGAQSSVVLSSLVGDVSQVAAAASGASGAVGTASLPAANVTNISTAIAVLTTQALGGKAPTSAADVASTAGAFTSGQTIQMATAIKLVADAGVALPAGVTDTLALASDAATYSTFVATQSTQNAALYTQTQDAVLSDPAIATAPATPAVGGADQTLLLVLGTGAGGNTATRVVLHADKTASIEEDALRTATWSVSGADLTVLYDQPIVQTDDDAVGNGDGSTYTTVITGELIRQVGGGSGSAQATIKPLQTTTYVSGPNAQVTYPAPGFVSEALVGTVGSFTAADVAPGTRWAGVMSTGFVNNGGITQQDILRVVDGTNAVFELSKVNATYALTAGALVVTTPDATYTYRRLFTGARGEERWLVEKAVAGTAQWLYDVAAFKVQTDVAALTTTSLTRRWLSDVNAGLVADQIYIDLLADGTGTGTDIGVDGSTSHFAYGSTWSVTGDGLMLLTNNAQHRTWQLLGTLGARNYVLEHLVASNGYDQYRVNVYTGQ